MGLSRKTLASRAGVSVSTIRYYEDGRRNPSHHLLTDVLNALKLEQIERNVILRDAGLVAEGPPLSARITPGYAFTLNEATRYIERLPWPANIVNEYMEVVAANGIAQRLWGINLYKDFPTPVERNYLSVGSTARIANKIVNWSEVVQVGIAILKGHHRGPETDPDKFSAYYAAVFQHFLRGDQKYVEKFMELWANTSPRTPKVRWSFPVTWKEPDIGALRFSVIVTPANEPAAIGFNDWIPLDAPTWQALEIIRTRRP